MAASGIYAPFLLRVPAMAEDRFILGIDLGSISLKLALIEESGAVRFTRWVRVAGEPLAVLGRELMACAAANPGVALAAVGATGSGRGLIAPAAGAVEVNEITAHAAATSKLLPAVQSIIEIGGQDSKLIILGSASADAGAELAVQHFSMNELCAAGTGAFLDQQAARLNLSIEAFAALAAQAGDPAPIAGRCAVFAKTDMTHHQQSGRPLSDIVAGLNEALARSYLSNLVRGRELPRPVAFQGGVASNEGLRAAFRRLLALSAEELVVPEHHRTMGAIGAALLASRQAADRPPLTLEELAGRMARPAASAPPSSAAVRARRLQPPAGSPARPAFTAFPEEGTFLGIDVGSVSVKLAAVGRSGIVASDYRFSDGRPVETLAAMLSALRAAGLEQFDAVGVTGSGRHFIGALVRADAVRNEITAQAQAAALLHPGTDTVVEIGGQDAKFMRLEGGRPVHFEMNRVCAAGTGAFLQEQAARLGIDLTRDFAAEAFSSTAPAELGVRCTVFMESDLVAHQQSGFARRDLIAGLAHSVVANYREKVVAGQPVGERVLFLGGVAENRAVVAALEAQLGRSVTTSAVGKLSGAIGAALAAAEAKAAGRVVQSRFRSDPDALSLQQLLCEECPNRCAIQRTTAEPIRTFGGRCGRHDTERHSRRSLRTSLLAQRERLLFGGEAAEAPDVRRSEDLPIRRIGVPRALFAFDLYPAWRAFFTSLGFEILLSPATDDAILAEGMKRLVVETCLPVKAFCSHVHWLTTRGVDAILAPSLVSTGIDAHGKETLHCPYIQGLAAMAAPIAKATPLIAPVINWRLDPQSHAREMVRIACKLGCTRRRAAAAWKQASEELRGAREQLRALGRRVLAQLESGRIGRAFLVLGKDYNVNDPRLSSRIAITLEEMGEVVLTQDMLADDGGAYPEAYRTMYWSHGKEMLAAAAVVAATPGLVPVLVTSFGCGPDSFTTRFLRDVLGDKPLLTLEVDEHSSAVGMQTRIEAFIDALPGSPAVRAAPHRPAFSPPPGIRRVFLPNFSDHGYAFAASIAALGLTPVLTPLPDQESAKLGMAHACSGECHPFALMLGDYIKVAQGGEDLSDACYFMPEGGACRVGQFGGQMRLIAEELGSKLPIFTRVEELAAVRGGQPVVAGIRAVSTYWEMMRGMDFLMQSHLTARAYEAEPGSADRAKKRSHEVLMEAILAGRPREGLKAARDIIAAVETDKRRRRARIGITGDYYTRVCDFANGGLFREIERLGGEVWLPPTMSDFVKYDAHQRIGAALRHRNRTELVKAAAMRAIVGPRERAARRIFDADLDYEIPLEYGRACELLKPYMDIRLPAGLTGSVAAVLEQIQAGADGIVNAITFHCTYGLVVSSVLASIDRDTPQVPKLTLIFEGLKPTHNRMRLEAFMERVHARKRP